ncbi:MAG: N-methyl-L-tryptophan oxidase [Planctomycetes bacterium]|nr:N-methyl-L-tryptophan oxidase [Planctomycetota bacterium]
MTNTYETIVIGTGAVGSAALAVLARRGVRVLGLDRFPPAHDRGSSHGQTRIIRQAYFEHPDYVPLTQRAFAAWHELEQRRGVSLYQQSGLLQVGPPQGEVVAGVLASARLHGLEVDQFDAATIRQKFSGFVVNDPWVGVFERRAGFLRVESCVQTMLDAAVADGATLQTGESVVAWQATDKRVTVQTDRGEYQAARLIIAAGAWASQVLADLKLPLTVRRKPQLWFAPRGDQFTVERGMPCYLFDTPAGIFYGFPQLGPEGMKVAEHTGGAIVADPLTVDRSLHVEEVERVRDFLREHLPAAAGDCTRQAVCMYTLTPDAHFVIDRHPGHANVSFAAGLSGHGFKFAPVLGEAVADLALEGKTELPIGFLSMSRFGR